MSTGVSGSTVIQCDLGSLTIGQIAALHPTSFGFHEYIGPKVFLENGYLATPRFFYIAKPIHLYELRLVNGSSLRCRKDHCILTKLGWRAIGKLTPDHKIAHTKHYFSLAPNNTIPVQDITKYPDYVLNNVNWVPIQSINAADIEPQFAFAIPYYSRFITNNLISKD